MKPALHAYTTLATIVNQIINSNPPTDLTYKEVFDAMDENRLIPLLADRFDRHNQLTWVTVPHATGLESMNAALRDAAAAYEGRVGRPTSRTSGLCLVMFIILEAIQQQSTCRPAR